MTATNTTATKMPTQELQFQNEMPMLTALKIAILESTTVATKMPT
jgi:hypothetical protein